MLGRRREVDSWKTVCSSFWGMLKLGVFRASVGIGTCGFSHMTRITAGRLTKM